MPPTPLIPEDAPFSPAQRAWLNGFLAGLYGDGQAESAEPPLEDFPWHDPSLALEERLSLADGRTLADRLMAAMAQLDCGQCGYLCRSYADALAGGAEASMSRCVPGARPTSKALKFLLADRPAARATPAKAPVGPAGAPVRVLAAHRLTGEGSAKDVRHIVIDLAGSGLTYQPGDSLGLTARHDPALVEAVIAALAATGAEAVTCPDGTQRALREALAGHFDIARPQDAVPALLAAAATDPQHAAALGRLAEGADDAEPTDADLLDLLEAFGSARPPLPELIGALAPLQPRLYSIASSPRATPGGVHLCVATVRTLRRGRLRQGVASAFLADRAVGAGAIPAHVQSSTFRLPADPATPVVMIGPGTGIAPFRAFLQERAATGQRGPTWLFFGEQHRATDFLFEADFCHWLAEGVLTRLDLAFSRDQAEKIYVQHRMREHAAELWRWLQEGAHVYVCGDAQRMARDVDLALRAIAMTEGGMSEVEAKHWMSALARQGRYLRDVY